MNRNFLSFLENINNFTEFSRLKIDTPYRKHTYLPPSSFIYDIDYIKALKQYKNGIFDVTYYLHEINSEEKFGKRYVEVLYKGFYFLLLFEDAPYLDFTYELTLLEIKSKNNDVYYLNYDFRKSIDGFLIELVSDVINDFTSFEADYCNASIDDIDLDWELKYIVGGNFNGHHDFHRQNYEERKNQFEKEMNLRSDYNEF